MKRRVSALLLAVVTSIALLEAILQVGAFGLWVFGADKSSGVGTGPAILCVGDSFTYGLGTSSGDQAYPAQLERLLQEGSGPEWRVVNGGWPGRDSREVLTAVPGLIQSHRPGWLCVLVGINDRWNQPARAQVSMTTRSEPEGFRFELRTLRLVRLMLHGREAREANQSIDAAASRSRGVGSIMAAEKSRPDPARASADKPAEAARPTAPEAQPHPPVPEPQGWWLLAEQPVRIAAETFELNGARLPFAVTDRGFELQLSGEKLAGTWHVVGDTLTLTTDKLQIRLQRVIAPSPAAPAAAAAPAPEKANAPPTQIERRQAAWKLAGQDAEASAKQFRELFDEFHSPWDRHGLVFALRVLGRADEARRETDGLGADWQRAHDEHTGECYLRALETTGRAEEAAAQAEALLAVWPDNSAGWSVKALWHKGRNEHEAAITSYENAIRLIADPAGPFRAELLRGLTEVVAARDPSRAVAALLESYVCDHNTIRTSQVLAIVVNEVARVDREAILATVVSDAADRDALRRILASQGRPDPAFLNVLTDHIHQIADICRSQGIGCLVLGYPFDSGDIDAAQRQAAALAGVPFVAVWPRVQGELQSRKREELFVADGHCTDLGYGILAATVHEALAPLLKGR